MIERIDGTFTRLAHPLRSSAFERLADSATDLTALAALMDASQSSRTARDFIALPFLHPAPSRFSDGSYGVLYVADSLRTAVKEKCHHLARYFADAHAPAQTSRQVALDIELAGEVRNVRRGARDRSVPPAIYDPLDYRAAQAFARTARESVAGLHYDSVRNAPKGHCVGAFRSGLVRRATIAGDVQLLWNGERFSEQRAIEPIE